MLAVRWECFVLAVSVGVFCACSECGGEAGATCESQPAS